MQFLQLFSLPLLTKELIEQAQNKRTYILRTLYAAALYVPALLQYHNLNGGGSASGVVNFGQGRNLFLILTLTQAWMILLLLPPITCGALTVEKEKDTLALLLLTKLSPWTIIFEKFLSRIFAMGTYQLLSLPLFAIVYGIGGVELGELIFAIVALISLTMVVGSLSILTSSWFRTTSVAFVMTYLLLLILGSGVVPLTYGIVISLRMRNFPPAPVVTFWDAITDMMMQPQVMSLLGLVILPMLLSIACLFLASKVLIMRAFVPAHNIVLEMFRFADRFFNELNKATTGGIILVPDRISLPHFDPIAWRETQKKSLGTFRYQFRILMLLLAPLILAISAVLTESRTDFTSPFRIFPAFFWVVSVICLTIHATGAIPSERIRQTLDVLLVCPIAPAEIVREKLAGVRRLIMILTVPFAILVLFQAIWSGYVIQGATTWQSANFWLELTTISLATVIYMPVIMWTGFQMGLRMRTQIQAVLSTFAFIGAACALPVILIVSWDNLDLNQNPSLNQAQEPWLIFLMRWLNPLQVLFGTGNLSRGVDPITNTFYVMNPRFAWFVIGVHFAIYGALWWWLRRNAMQSFSRIVRRLEPNPDSMD